jgi:TPR repeat protein
MPLSFSPREIPRHNPARITMSKVKVLFFAADPLSAEGRQPRLRLDTEAQKIDQEVIAALHRDNVDFKTCWATRIEDLRQGLNREKPDIVHFSGHGGGEGLVLVASGGRAPHRVGAEALKQFFAAYRGQIQVVVLNACHSRPQAEAIAEAVGCAIGTPSKISDDAAVAFSAAFYSSIAFGKSVQTAFDQARATLHMEDFAEHEWPVLVHRDDVDPSQLFLIPAESTPAIQTAADIPPPVPPAKPVRRMAWPAAAVVLWAAAAVAIWLIMRPDPTCARAREMQRFVMEAGTPAQRVGLLSSPAASAGPNDPMAGPRELVEAKRLHRAGDHAADFSLFRQAAEAGNPEAMTSLGLAYLRGEGTPVQEDSAVKWLRAAANKGDPRGMTELGNAYLRREGVNRDSDHLAKHWYEKAAALDYAEAMRNLGNLYREGRGVSPDSALALDWYERAAREGFADALVDTGWMYEKGLSVAPNGKQAMCWYEAAADAGSARGKAAIGQVDENAKPSDEDMD